MDKYFNSINLLENTLLSYFCDEEPLKLINKLFSKLNYEKYNTHIRPHGIVITYYSDIKTMETKITYKNGKKDGLYEKWNKYEQLCIRQNYKNGKLDGLDEEWDKYNLLYIRQNHKNGKLDGLYEEWWSEDMLAVKCFYCNGKKEGLYESWNYDGTQNIKCYYKEDKQHGIYQRYNIRLEIECNFIDGVCHGEFKKWHDSEHCEIINYINGKICK